MKTISRSECTNLAMVSGNEKRFRKIVMGDTVKEWVGFGWIDVREATDKDRKRLHVVSDD